MCNIGRSVPPEQSSPIFADSEGKQVRTIIPWRKTSNSIPCVLKHGLREQQPSFRLLQWSSRPFHQVRQSKAVRACPTVRLPWWPEEARLTSPTHFEIDPQQDLRQVFPAIEAPLEHPNPSNSSKNAFRPPLFAPPMKRHANAAFRISSPTSCNSGSAFIT